MRRLYPGLNRAGIICYGQCWQWQTLFINSDYHSCITLIELLKRFMTQCSLLDKFYFGTKFKKIGAVRSPSICHQQTLPAIGYCWEDSKLYYYYERAEIETGFDILSEGSVFLILMRHKNHNIAIAINSSRVQHAWDWIFILIGPRGIQILKSESLQWLGESSWWMPKYVKLQVILNNIFF